MMHTACKQEPETVDASLIVSTLFVVFLLIACTEIAQTGQGLCDSKNIYEAATHVKNKMLYIYR